jgi:hypothetical protein
MKINTIIAALAMASSALSAAMPGSRYYITGTRTLEPTTTSRPRQYYITGTRTLPGFISVAARETGAALEVREDIDISTYAGRGIDLAGLPKCHVRYMPPCRACRQRGIANTVSTIASVLLHG